MKVLVGTFNQEKALVKNSRTFVWSSISHSFASSAGISHRLCGLCELWLGFDHDVAVGEDGEDDGVGEEGVGQHRDRDPPDRVKRGQEEHRLGRREPVDAAALGQDHEGSLVCIVRVYVHWKIDIML